MTDSSGLQLQETIYKRFQVTAPIRDAVTIEQWTIAPPLANSRQPLALTFPRSMDWALLSHKITVESQDERPVIGHVAIDQCERRWTFTPASPWAPISHRVHIAPDLEDVCGNSMRAAFDRPLRPIGDLAQETPPRSISFCPLSRSDARQPGRSTNNDGAI
jgi:hypothetical protein